MDIVNEFSLNCNKNLKINFDGGDLSSDAGLLIVKEFVKRLGFDEVIRKTFHTKDSASYRQHSDFANLMQNIYLCTAGYFADDRSDDLSKDPTICECLDKDRLASQPTISRFYNRMDESTLEQIEKIQAAMREIVYHSTGCPLMVRLDLDTTLLPTYGDQEGSAWNAHYRDEGYHPTVCYDGITGDLIKLKLRDGTDYCCKGVADFLKPVLEEYRAKCPATNLMVRADSGFATPELYTLCEEFGAHYVIRLKGSVFMNNSG